MSSIKRDLMLVKIRAQARQLAAIFGSPHYVEPPPVKPAGDGRITQKDLDDLRLDPDKPIKIVRTYYPDLD